jgi:hypothetical protein
MHNKFILFAKVSRGANDRDIEVISPYAVLTGSFYFTKNAINSLENALYISIPLIVIAYYIKFDQSAIMSEPVDWSADWVEPEWRVGIHMLNIK